MKIENVSSLPILKTRKGFRCSAFDLMVLICSGGLAAWLYFREMDLWWIVLAVTGHFFLFCNVFLVWRRLELIWAGCFVAIIFWHLGEGNMSWYPSLLQILPVTLAVILLQIKSPWYRGVFSKRINPGWETFITRKTTDK